MTEQHDNQDWREQQFDYGKYRFFYRILGGAVLVGIGVLIGWWLFSEKQADYLLSLFTNLLSIFVTVFVLDLLAQRREERREMQQLKERLIRNAGSTSNETAKSAIDELRKYKWLEDTNGLLRGADLHGANLEHAHLRYANLADANLCYANLCGTNLHHSNLQNVKLFHTQFNTSTILPDGTNWSSDIDMCRFTDSSHLHFWRSDKSSSPAFRGKEED